MMRCEEVQDILDEYMEDRIPELSRRRVDHHLAACGACRSEYEMIKESGEWIQSDKEQYASVKMTKSFVDAVMSRILSEEKWAIPIGKKVFTLTARMRRYGVSAAIILLFLCSFTLYSNTEENDSFATAMVSTTIKKEVTSAEETISSESRAAAVEKQVSVAALDEVVSEPAGQELLQSASSVIPGDTLPAPEKSAPNYSLILSIFGILITVITMSWMTRV